MTEATPVVFSLQDLVRGGYLTTNDVRAFEGMELTFITQADESQPQAILALAHTPDGQFVCLLGDGSVQQLAPSRYEEMRAKFGQPAAQ